MAISPRRSLLVIAAFLVAILILVLTPSLASRASAQSTGLKLPAPAGTEWEVLAGYNTVTHEGVDPYALDLWRVDGETGGTPLLAPMDGRIGYASDTCVSVRTDVVNLMMCHVYVDSSLDRGDQVVTGQRLGTVAPDGEAENNGVAHIHLQLNVRDDDSWSDGDSLPFEGPFAIEGVDFSETDDSNAHFGRAITSTNAEGDAPEPSISAGPDRTVQPGETVTLQAQVSGTSDVFWVQESGPSVVSNISEGPTFSFVAPADPGAVSFQVIANANGTLYTDTVSISVQPSAAEPAPEPVQEEPQEASLLSGEVLHGGISLVVFSGGTTAELIAAIACPLPDLAMWASNASGNLVQYSTGVPDFVNARWVELFPSGVPELTPLLLKCE